MGEQMELFRAPRRWFVVEYRDGKIGGAWEHRADAAAVARTHGGHVLRLDWHALSLRWRGQFRRADDAA